MIQCICTAIEGVIGIGDKVINVDKINYYILKVITRNVKIMFRSQLIDRIYIMN